MADEHEHFWEIIGGMSVCMVTTVDDGIIRSRPMVPYVDPAKRTIHFMTDSGSAKIFEIKDETDMALNFADTGQMLFASVSAKGSVTQDQKLIDQMWGPYAEVFFGSDPKEADVTIIKATPVQAEYWDNNKNSLIIAAEMTKAYFTDEGPNLGTNAKLDF
ncbi:pyridoxamine 5'-phosphate oxidase family protein [Yoonia sp. 208BN28-4]|uniref:pyridoxamine 5'-phosphate oxidase family protein n=1 Tax=Yoonia sp. 208BN28-4 TaxID=3126505 RepID=UPI0030B554FD